MITHESCIAPLLARTHLIFYPDNGWGKGAGRYMWVDAQGRLFYFRYHADKNEITEYWVEQEWTEVEIKRGFYVLNAEHLIAPSTFEQLPILEKLERTYARFQALLEQLSKEALLLQISEKQWIGHHPILKHVVLEVLSTTVRIERMHSGHEKQILTVLWNAEMPNLLAPNKEWTASVLPYFQYIEEHIAALQSGDYGLRQDYQDETGVCYTYCQHRWIGMPLKNGRLDNSRLMNPFAFLSDENEILGWLQREYFSPNYSYLKLSALDEGLKSDLPQMDHALKKSKAQVLDDYIAAFKTGLRISMGPTTDQTWTIYYEKGQFWTSGYKPTEDGGYKQYVSPYTEEETRRVLSTYKMFGLWRLVD